MTAEGRPARSRRVRKNGGQTGLGPAQIRAAKQQACAAKRQRQLQRQRERPQPRRVRLWRPYVAPPPPLREQEERERVEAVREAHRSLLQVGASRAGCLPHAHPPARRRSPSCSHARRVPAAAVGAPLQLLAQVKPPSCPSPPSPGAAPQAGRRARQAGAVPAGAAPAGAGPRRGGKAGAPGDGGGARGGVRGGA